MTDPLLPAKRSFGRSLTLRILLICLFLLVIPLILNELFLYHLAPSFPRLISLFFFVLIIGGGSVFLLTRRMDKPFDSLAHVMHQVAEGNLEARFHQDRLGFEINALGESFNQTIESLIQNIQRREALESELKIGHEIQKSILPKEMPQVEGIELAAGFIPAQEVAGDFYDCFETEDQLLIAIGDASGKGVSACLYSFCVRSFLRSQALHSHDLSSIVKSTNNLFHLDTADTGSFVTAWIGLYDAKSKILHYSSCGHPCAILKKKSGPVKELTTPGIALGVVPIDQVSTSHIQLSSGDFLLLYTDGVTDAHDINHHPFSKMRLFEFAEKHYRLPTSAFIEKLIAEVRSFSGDVPLYDDFTTLALRVL